METIFNNNIIKYPVSGTTAIAIFSLLTIIQVFTISENDEKIRIDDKKLTSSKLKIRKLKNSYSKDLGQEVSTIDATDLTMPEDNEKENIEGKDKKFISFQ